MNWLALACASPFIISLGMFAYWAITDQLIEHDTEGMDE
jgi:hypothetical protein